MTDSTVKPCQLHFGPSPDGRYGTLIDPNGHQWKICSECINSLWQDKQPLNQPENTSILDAIVRVARETQCDCSVCTGLTLGAEISGYNATQD